MFNYINYKIKNMEKIKKHDSNTNVIKSIPLISDDMLISCNQTLSQISESAECAKTKSDLSESQLDQIMNPAVLPVKSNQNDIREQEEKRKYYPKPKKFKKPNIKKETADRIMKESNFGRVKVIDEYSKFFKTLQSVTKKSPRYHKFGLIQEFGNDIIDQMVKIRNLNNLDSLDPARLTYFNELIEWIKTCIYRIHCFYKTDIISKHGYINLIFYAKSILTQLQKWNGFTKEVITKNQKLKSENN